jgi:hypothetical protein
MEKPLMIAPSLLDEMAKSIVESPAYQRKLVSAKASHERTKQASKK